MFPKVPHYSSRNASIHSPILQIQCLIHQIQEWDPAVSCAIKQTVEAGSIRAAPEKQATKIKFRQFFYTYEGICWCIKRTKPKISVTRWNLIELSRVSETVSMTVKPVSPSPSSSSIAQSSVCAEYEALLQIQIDILARWFQFSFRLADLFPSSLYYVTHLKNERERRYSHRYFYCFVNIYIFWN